MLHVTEIFRSLQGESTWAGCPCVFIRLSGCNLACRYCDTAYAQEPGDRLSVEAIVERALALVPGRPPRIPLVEVTGGEPLRQKAAHRLLEALADIAGTVLVETNGSIPLPAQRRFHAILDVKCPGSGMAGRMHWENLASLRPGDEVKFVICDRADFDYALATIRDYRLGALGIPLLLSPVAGEVDLQALAAWTLEADLPLRMQLQMHKIIWPATLRGV